VVLLLASPETWGWFACESVKLVATATLADAATTMAATRSVRNDLRIDVLP
jgi:hypothetical protein